MQNLHAQIAGLGAWQNFSKQKLAELETRWQEWEGETHDFGSQTLWDAKFDKLNTECRKWWDQWEGHRATMLNLTQRVSFMETTLHQSLAEQNTRLGIMEQSIANSSQIFTVQQKENQAQLQSIHSDLSQLLNLSNSPSQHPLDESSKVSLMAALRLDFREMLQTSLQNLHPPRVPPEKSWKIYILGTNSEP